MILQEKGTSTNTITATEYFAAFMTTLESNTSSLHCNEILTLLAMTLPNVPESVLRLKFGQVSEILEKLIIKEQSNTYRGIITCIGMMLKAQETSEVVWKRPSVLKCFHCLMEAFNDTRPKVRKLAQQYILGILQVHQEKKSNTLAIHVANMMEKVIKQFDVNQETSRLLQVIGFLKLALPYFTNGKIQIAFNQLYALMALDVKMVTMVCLLAIDATVGKMDSEISNITLKEMMGALKKLDISMHDADLAILVLRITSNGMVRMMEEADDSGVNGFIMFGCTFFQSNQKGVHGAASKAILKVAALQFGNNMKNNGGETITMVTSLKSLLSLRYQPAWNAIFPMLSKMYDIFNINSYSALNPIANEMVKAYESICNMPHSIPGIEKLFQDVLGTIVQNVGIRRFLELVPITENVQTPLPDKRLWVLALLRVHGKNCTNNELQAFIDMILPLAKVTQQQVLETKNAPLEAKQWQVKTMQLWGLFPGMCTQAGDVDIAFSKIAKTLAGALSDKKYPELALMVCQGLQNLMSSTTSQDKKHAIFAKYGKKYLPLLMSIVESMNSEKESDRITIFVDTIKSFLGLVPLEFRITLFKQLIESLLTKTSTKFENKTKEKKVQMQCHNLMHMLVAFVEFMDENSVALLYRVVQPYLLNDLDAMMQKRAYTLLVAICTWHPKFTCQPQILQTLIATLCDSLLTCSIPAKKMRLRSLTHIMEAIKNTTDMNLYEFLPPLVGEIILCTKEANGKAREIAFEVLISMASLMDSKNKQKGLTDFLEMITGGLAGQTPHMRSATVVSLSRVIFEFGKTNDQIKTVMPMLLETILLLLHEKAREVIKSVIGFLKLSIAILSKDEFQVYLPNVITGLLQWIGTSKNRFRAKVRIIMIKLCRKYGYDVIMELVPEADQKLIAHIKKETEKDQQKHTKTVDKKSDTFDSFMSDDESENEEDQTQNTKSKTMLMERDDEIVDFLDQSAVKNIVSKKQASGRKQHKDDEFNLAKDGRIIIQDDEKATDEEQLSDIEVPKIAKSIKSLSVKRNEKPSEASGSKFKAKKAGGDVKKKDSVEPYAYLPLDPKHMAKRNKRSAVQQYNKVVKAKRRKR